LLFVLSFFLMEEPPSGDPMWHFFYFLIPPVFLLLVPDPPPSLTLPTFLSLTSSPSLPQVEFYSLLHVQLKLASLFFKPTSEETPPTGVIFFLFLSLVLIFLTSPLFFLKNTHPLFSFVVFPHDSVLLFPALNRLDYRFSFSSRFFFNGCCASPSLHVLPIPLSFRACLNFGLLLPSLPPTCDYPPDAR